MLADLKVVVSGVTEIVGKISLLISQTTRIRVLIL